MENTFVHRHAAHCESGTMSSLLRHHGLDVSEPMAFGLASALIFVHLPFVKVGGFPLTAYRAMPGTIVRGLQKSLGVKMATRTYRRPRDGMADLDAQLAAGHVVGLQTSVYWLPYFPPDMRFHFNAHNLMVYGKRGDDYLISDPVFEHPVTCPAADLEKARFVKGVFAPRGRVFWPTEVPAQVDWDKAIRRAIRKTAFQMLRTPLPIIGIRGIRLLARQVRKLGRNADPRYARLFVNQVIRMQEEIGTGGGGFRFMYASFLQEAGQRLDDPRLQEASGMMTEVGDRWREFALRGVQATRKGGDGDYEQLARLLEGCAEGEQAVFGFLYRR
jgi:hypothetical protein